MLDFKMKDVFKCVDSYDDVSLKSNDLQRLAFFFTPCDKLPWGPYEIEDECIRDKNQQIAYLDPNEDNDFHTFFFYNLESFDLEKYGDESIKRVSKMYQ